MPRSSAASVPRSRRRVRRVYILKHRRSDRPRSQVQSQAQWSRPTVALFGFGSSRRWEVERQTLANICIDGLADLISIREIDLGEGLNFVLVISNLPPVVTPLL